MKFETTRFGAIDIDPEVVITFTQPIIGFQTLRRFVLLPGPGGGRQEDNRVKWLQSTELAEAAFLLMDPRSVCPDYKADLRAEELMELGVNSVSELDVYTLLVVPLDHAQIRTNLKAPIVINMKQRLAKQAILDRQDYPIQFFLLQESQSSEEPLKATPPEEARR
jgi:flagellar assembly factor FliW